MLFKKMYLAILDVHGRPEIKEFNDSEKTKKWIDDEINKLKQSYPNWDWQSKWKIIPFNPKKVLKK